MSSQSEELSSSTKPLLERFEEAYESDSPDQRCIDLICKDDPEIQKKQLQIAMGLNLEDEIISAKHPNNRLELQAALIKQLEDDKNFLSSLLRDFVFRTVGFRDKCPNVGHTIDLLVKAGADPNIDHFDKHYQSPGVDHVNKKIGRTVYENIKDAYGDDKALISVFQSNNIEEKRTPNNQETLLRNFINIIPPNLRLYSFNVGTKDKIIDDLLLSGLNANNIDDLLSAAEQDYFQNNTNLSDLQIRELQRKIQNCKTLIRDRIFFKENLEAFSNAYENDERNDDDCIDLISDDPEVQKRQLQIALGVSNLARGRMLDEHNNKRLKLQAALISRLKDNEQNIPFLTSALRDFICRPCDGGQLPCPNAVETLRLLLDAGADPNSDHLDEDYQSPGLLFVLHQDGKTLYDIINVWSQHKDDARYSGARAIMEELLNFRKDNSPTSPEITLFMLVKQISKNLDNPRMAIDPTPLIKNFIDNNNITVDQLRELLTHVKNRYYPEVINKDDFHNKHYRFNEVKNKLDALSTAEALLVESIHHLDDFKKVYESDEPDQSCIDLISDEPEILKKQLQIALGVSNPITGSGRMPLEHKNKRVELQNELVNRLKTQENIQPFMTSVLRDFFMRVCDNGQVPCPNASQTFALLIEAGADPTATALDENYQSPGVEFVNHFNGRFIRNHVAKWGWNPESALIWDVLNKYDGNTFSIREYHKIQLLKQLVTTFIEHENPSKELISDLCSGLKVSEIPTFFNAVKDNYYPNLETLDDDDENKKEILGSFRQAEAAILETIYKKEVKEQQSLLRTAKFSLIFAPLVLPLIFTAVVGVMYLVKKYITNTVSAKDLTLDEFKDKLSTKAKLDISPEDDDEEIVEKINQTYAIQFPIKSKENVPQLRKAVVFNKDATQGKSYSKLPSIFSGLSNIGAKEEGKLKKDVRIYKVHSDKSSNGPSRK